MATPCMRVVAATLSPALLGVAACALGLGGGLQHGDRRARLTCGQRRARRRIARTHHQYIDLKIVHASLLT